MKKLLLLLVLLFSAGTALAQFPFTPIDTNFGIKTISIPTGFDYSTLFIGGVDSVYLANGTRQLSKESQDLIVYIPKNGISSTEGRIYVGHETSGSDATRGNGGAGTVFDIKKGPNQWEVIGNRIKVDFTTVGGTSNNCAGNLAPKGTVFSAEESVPSSNAGLSWGSDTADFLGYKRYLNNGFMVEVDPMNAVALRKVYAMGRYAHEGCTFMPDRKTAYLTEDATPACLFKFVADNVDDYSAGQLYAYKQSVDGLTGTWLPIPRHRDSLNITKTIALRLGATLFIRLEDCEVGPDGSIYIAETGSDNANLTKFELSGNKPALHLEPYRNPGTSSILDTFGRIIKLDPITGKVTNFLQGGRGADGITCVSNPDNIAIDFKRNLMAFHEDINGTSAGRSLRGFTTCENYYIDLSIPNPTVNDAKRFLICPVGGEATGIWFTPDYETYFVNIQHPTSSDFFPFSKATTVAISPTNVKSKFYTLRTSPFIGFASGIPLYQSGFSGLDMIPGVDGGYMTLCDRGPNVDADNLNGGTAAGYFPNTGFNPAFYEIRTEADSIRVVKVTTLKNPTGGPVSGLPMPDASNVPHSTYYSSISPITDAPTDIYGIDCESIVQGIDNDYIIGDEYGPSVWSVDKTTGKVKTRFTPYTIGANDVLIDTVYKYRRSNRGFEDVAVTPSGKFVAILQSPAYNPNGTAGDASQIHRLLEYDMTNGKMKTYAYLHQPKTGNLREKDWKIGDLVAINDYEFLVIEHALRNGEDSKKIYKIDLRGATPTTTDNFGGKTLEQLVDAKGLAGFEIVPVQRSFFFNLLANGWDPKLEKPEGLTIVNDSTISICNDNDFGIISPNVDGQIVATGVPTRLYTYTLPPEQKIKNYIRINTRINPRLSVSPSVLKFDSISTTQSTSKTVVLTNNGTNTVKITNQYFTSNDGDFSFIPLSGANLTVKPGETRTVTVTFKPLQFGTRVARIGFKTDIPETYSTPRVDTSLITLDVWANGVPSARITGNISDPDTVLVGNEHCRMDTIYNDGDAPLTINNIKLGGAYPNEFKVSGFTLPFVLGAKKKMILTICSKPSAPGLRPAALEFYGRAADKNISYYLSITSFGTKVAIIAKKDSIFTYEHILVGSNQTEDIIIKNIGNIATIYNVEFLSKKPDGYSFGTSVKTGNIEPEQEITLPVTFTPTNIGGTNETILITAANASPINVKLSAVGTGVRLTSPVSFAQSELGKSGVEYQLPIKNEGNIEWVSGTPILDGTFSYVNGLTTPIAVGETRDITLLYSPNATSDTVGSITFPNSSPLVLGENTITLHGKVLATSDVSVTDKAAFAITRIHPNPTNTEASIEYTLPGSSDVTMEIGSVSGEILKQVIEKGILSGTHHMSINVSAFPSGSYIVTLKTEFGTTRTNLSVVK